MKKFFFCFTLFSWIFLQGKESWLVTNTLHHIGTIEALFTNVYGPMEWKRERFCLDFSEEAKKARQTTITRPPKSLREAQSRLAELLNVTHDYHVSIGFASTERATLPFTVKTVGGKVYVASVENGNIDLAVGDEILTFDGKPIGRILRELSLIVGRDSNPVTDRSLAEMALTARAGSFGIDVPKGILAVTYLTPGDSSKKKATLSWEYEEERIGPPLICHKMSVATFPNQEKRPSSPSSLMRVLPFYEQIKGCHFGESAFHIGSRHPILSFDDAIWKNNPEEYFQSAIFKGEEERMIGYLRIPSFMYDDEEKEKLTLLIAFLQENSDLLVLDLMGNPGGRVFGLYDLLARLTPYPITLFQERSALDQNQVLIAHALIEFLSDIQFEESEEEERRVRILQECHFITTQWSEGKTLSDAHFLLGYNTLHPHQEGFYSKPLLVLANECSFSCGDLAPAILQANSRAKILGTTTAGAGGGVERCFIPNLFGIAYLSYTSSIVYDHQNRPLENRGVVPDMPYQITLEDITMKGVGLKKKIVEEAKLLLSR